MGRQPGARTLDRSQAAVQAHDSKLRGRLRGQMCKPLAQPRLELRRQVDLGHQPQRLRERIGLERRGQRAQVHLGLAAAGDSMQQKRRKSARPRDGVDRLELLVAQARWPGCRGGHLGRRRPPQPGQPCGRPRARDTAQRWRQRTQRDLRPGMVVIIGCELAQLQPLLRQRRIVQQGPQRPHAPLFE